MPETICISALYVIVCVYSAISNLCLDYLALNQCFSTSSPRKGVNEFAKLTGTVRVKKKEFRTT